MFRKEEVDGKVVVEASGKGLGKAKDIAFALDGSVALIVQGNDNAEIQISMDRIAGVGDYIVVRRENRGEQAPKKAPSPAPAAAPSASAPAAARPNQAIPVAAPLIPPPPPSAAIPVGAPSAGTGLCRGCGAPLRAGAKFCTKCGTPV